MYVWDGTNAEDSVVYVTVNNSVGEGIQDAKMRCVADYVESEVVAERSGNPDLQSNTRLGRNGMLIVGMAGRAAKRWVCTRKRQKQAQSGSSCLFNSTDTVTTLH